MISCISYIDSGGWSRGMCEFLFLILTVVDAVGGCVSLYF